MAQFTGYYSLTAKCILLISSHKIIMCIRKMYISSHCFVRFGRLSCSLSPVRLNDGVTAYGCHTHIHNILSETKKFVCAVVSITSARSVVKVRCVLSCYLLLKHLSCTFFFLSVNIACRSCCCCCSATVYCRPYNHYIYYTSTK